jgi:hypothetical protein
VRAARQALEHHQGRGHVRGLAEDELVDDDDGIGAEHRDAPAVAGHGERLGARHAHHVVRCGLPGQHRLVDVRRPHHVRHAELRQQLAAPR